MQPHAIDATLQQTDSSLYLAQTSSHVKPGERLTVTNSPSLNQATLNQPKSARVQPKTSTIPSYSPSQPESVLGARLNNQVAESEKVAQVKDQQAKRSVQVADQLMASNLLTGAYNATSSSLPHSPRVGGYVATQA